MSNVKGVFERKFLSPTLTLTFDLLPSDSGQTWQVTWANIRGHQTASRLVQPYLGIPLQRLPILFTAAKTPKLPLRNSLGDRAHLIHGFKGPPESAPNWLHTATLKTLVSNSHPFLLMVRHYVYHVSGLLKCI